MPPTTSNSARLNGQYYTPSFLVEVMLRLALDPLLDSRRPDQEPPLRVLDPACGDGAFLIPAHDRLSRWYTLHGKPANDQIASHLYGADINRSALATLRSRLAELGHEGLDGDFNLPWGDALTGPGFGEPGGSAPPRSEGDEHSVPDLDWPGTFPHVAKQGGFDLIIGNPPYRRELASKRALDNLKESPLGKRWQRSRLDLSAYFLHRGLELLREGGRLAFILPSYWTASTAAGPLIERLEAETSIREVILLGRSPVFPNVEGWHMILSLVKGRVDQPCRVWDLSSSGKQVAGQLASIFDGAEHAPASYSLEQSELFRHGQLCLSPPDAGLQILNRSHARPLEERFEVRQGIVENPRRVTRAMAARLSSHCRVGQGVFVLSAEELQELDLSEEERKLLRPYYRGVDIERYRLAESPAEFLLYLTRATAASLEAFPKIEAHLGRFRPLLENRREVRRGRIAWWHLHWPREENLFVAPRILMPQMGYAPRFVFCERPAFAGFAMHVVRLRLSLAEANSPALAALTGVLNSELAARWFRRFAKHRGASLDISGSLLKRFPLPAENPDAEFALARMVRQRQQLEPQSERIAELETKIESLVQKWYES